MLVNTIEFGYFSKNLLSRSAATKFCIDWTLKYMKTKWQTENTLIWTVGKFPNLSEICVFSPSLDNKVQKYLCPLPANIYVHWFEIEWLISQPNDFSVGSSPNPKHFSINNMFNSIRYKKRTFCLNYFPSCSFFPFFTLWKQMN